MKGCFRFIVNLTSRVIGSFKEKNEIKINKLLSFRMEKFYT